MKKISRDVCHTHLICHKIFKFQRTALNLDTHIRYSEQSLFSIRGYIDAYLTNMKKYLPILQKYDGVITPDFTMLIGQSQCLLETQTYFNRAVGYYLQKNGIPVIPNIRWSDERSYRYCFLGVPKHSIVAISTHGCIRSSLQKKIFKSGLEEMLWQLEPSGIIVHGYMPDQVFGNYLSDYHFYHYPSLFEMTHSSADGRK
jgi:hypothetical protein